MINGTCRVWGCRFSNITFLTNAPAAHQGTALTFIDNVGGKRLNFVGLGKESATATISSCERGVYAQTSMPFTEAYVSDCKMVDIQNGVEIEGTGQGNFSKGRVSDCHIDCTNYLANIKKRSTGIEVKDPNISYSDFFLFNNDINVNLQNAFMPFFVPEALTTGISVTAMHNQASASAMTLDIGHNKVNLLHGLNGIVVENVASANIHYNEITKTLNSLELYYCLSVVGGLNNTLTCNTVTDLIQEATPEGISYGIYCESSQNFHITKNTVSDVRSALSVLFDNATDCIVSYNNFERNNQFPTAGLFYFDALTGPQYLRGNDWIGDFTLGAQYQQGTGAFTYCDSRYHVSPEANVANTTNLVDPGMPQDCIEGSDDWFTVLEEQEGDLTCGSSTSVVSSISKNEADLNLAGGGTLSLSPGYKWSSEMGLYRKFTDNPGLVSGDSVINGFLQSQQELPVAAMYGVQNGVREIEGGVPSGLMDDIQDALVLLATIEANMLALLPDIETDTNAWASYATLTAQVENLGQLLDGYLSDALDTMAQSAAAVQSTNGSINCSVLPCTSERYLIDLYLETQFVAPRALTSTELEAVEEIGMYCPKDAGNIVYMARAWYYMQTGEMLSADCGSFVPETVEERNIQTQAISDGYFLLMPNPADGSVQVVLPANHGAGMLLLTDLWGRLLYQRMIPEEAENVHISTEGLPNGIYMIVFKGQSGKPTAQKLVIQH